MEDKWDGVRQLLKNSVVWPLVVKQNEEPRVNRGKYSPRMSSEPRNLKCCVLRERLPPSRCWVHSRWLMPGRGIVIAHSKKPTHTQMCVHLGFLLNISKGQERKQRGEWILESRTAIPEETMKEPPFPSYNRNKIVWSLLPTLRASIVIWGKLPSLTL